MKKVLSFMIIALIALVALSTNVSAASVSSEDELKIALAGEDATITLTGNITLSAALEVGRTVTIDLNGYSITAADGMLDDSLIIVLHGGTLTVQDSSEGKEGKISATNSNADACIAIKMTKAECDISKTAMLIVNSGLIEGSRFGITGNGNDDRINTDVTILGGKVKGINGSAIYHPQLGTLLVDGGTIEGPTGIEIRSGYLKVISGTIIGTDTPVNVEPNGNGTTTDGAGIAVAQHTTKRDIDVEITGGTIQGYSALYHSNPQNNTTDNVSIQISGGKFETINEGTVSVYSVNFSKFISGGTFTSNVEEYKAEDVICKEVNGLYVVGKEHTITVDEVEGGTVTVNPTSAVVGETITLDITVDAGYELKSLEITDANGENVKTITGSTEFTMRDEDTRVVPVFAELTQTAELPNQIVDAEKVEQALLEELKSNEAFAEILEKYNVKVEVEVKEEIVETSDKEEIEQAVKEESEGIKVVKYIDITIKVNTADGTFIDNLEQLKEEITFTVEIPEEDLPDLEEGYKRTYYIVRNHNGEVKFLDAKETIDEETGKKILEFSSNLFSTYAIAYSDEKITNDNPILDGSGDNLGNDGDLDNENSTGEEGNVEDSDDENSTEEQDKVEDSDDKETADKVDKEEDSDAEEEKDKKDETPGTGSIDAVLCISIIIAVISLVGIVMVKKYTK